MISIKAKPVFRQYLQRFIQTLAGKRKGCTTAEMSQVPKTNSQMIQVAEDGRRPTLQVVPDAYEDTRIQSDTAPEALF